MTLSRRSILASTAALSAAAAAGCSSGSAGSPGASGSGPVTLRFTWWGNDLRNKLTTQVIELFQQQNQAIKISPEPGEWSGYWDKLATQVAGGTAPDIIQHDESQIAAYATRNNLLDLTTQKSLDLSTMDAKVLDTGKVGGKVYGAPVGIAIYSVAVNPAVLKAGGVATPDDKSWTWDQLADVSAQISAKTPGTYGIDGFGTGSAELVYWARQSGQALFPQGDEKALTADSVVAFWAYARKLIDTKAAPPLATQVENGAKPIDGSLFGVGKAAFHLLFHTQVQAFASAAKTDLALYRLPAITSGNPMMANKASMYWSISAKTRYPDAAARFVDFLINDPAAAKILLIERGVPAIPAIQKEVAPLLDATGKISLQFAQDLQAEVKAPPQVTPPTASKFGSEFTRISQDVLFNRAKPEDAAKQVAQMATDLNK